MLTPLITKANMGIDMQPMSLAFEAFKQTFPEYEKTNRLDELRATDYARLDQQGHVYLDYTGGALYAESQIRQHLTLLNKGVFGNPHSKNLTSLAMTELVEKTREHILRYFNASPEEYLAVFTLNSTGALKLLGESYPFDAGDHYLVLSDNHNSVNGIREYARKKRAAVTYVPVLPPNMRMDEDYLERALALAKPGRNNLFAFPAQSNFTGVQHSLEWIETAQAQGWDVLLDAAAFVPTNRLDLNRWHPDFVDISFYKMFGYPTGVGCLLARKSAVQKLRRPWYAGGTITFSSVAAFDHYLTPGPAGFEDGTVNYLGIPAVDIGLKWIESIGMDIIHDRVMCLTGWLIDQLLKLHHRNGRPLIKLYGPPNIHMRGGTVQMNFFDPAGQMIECYAIERLANEQHISLRAGCHCNPGAREAAIGFTREDLDVCFHDKDQIEFQQFLKQIEGKTTGAVRASIGLATNFADVYRFVQFAQGFADRYDAQ